MGKIYKYTLEIADEQSLMIPSHYIVSVKVQHGKIVVYAVCNDEIEPIEYKFFIRGTGHTVSLNWSRVEFLGTVLLQNDNLVFHVFYDKRAMRGV